MKSEEMVPETSAWREDALLGGRVRLRQPVSGYRVAIDPVLLAAAVTADSGQRLLELGCGTGAASLCLLSRCPELTVVGVEQQPEAVALARDNAALNGVADRLTVLQGDLRSLTTDDLGGPVDHVFCNPPYYTEGRHTPSPVSGKALSHGAVAGDLAEWVQAALRLMTARGQLTLIHRTERLAELLSLLQGRFGAIIVFPLWPRVGTESRQMLVTARRNRRSPLTLAAGLVLHADDGRFTDAAEAVLRHGQPLLLAGRLRTGNEAPG
jgi:tRNA1(Val) A37 N6-methylase TrmN6